MAISFIGSATGTTSATLPAHQAGDVIIAFAYRDGSTIAPNQPTTTNPWVNIRASGGSTNSSRIAYKVAAGSSEVTGTWTSVTSVIFAVYRGVDNTTPIGGNGEAAGSSTSINYPAVTMAVTNGTSWVVGAAGHRSTNVAIDTAPTGMINRTSVSDATDEAALHDTDGGVSSWSATSASVGGTSSGYFARTIELREAAMELSSDLSGDGSLSADASLITSPLVNSSLTASGTLDATLDLIVDGVRTTETLDRRVTESGDRRVTENFVSGLTYDEILNLSGNLTTATIATVIFNLASTLVGSLANLSASTITVGGSSFLSATGTLTSTAQRILNASMGISGAGIVTANMTYEHRLTRTLSAVGTLTPTPIRIQYLATGLTASGTMSIIARTTASPSLSLSGSVTVGAILYILRSVDISLTGTGSLSSSASVTGKLLANLSASSTVVVYPIMINVAGSMVGGQGIIIANATTFSNVSSSLSFTGTLIGNSDMIIGANVASGDNRRITEDGQPRITNTGDFRVTFSDVNLINSVFTPTPTVIPFAGKIFGHRNGQFKEAYPRVFYNGAWVIPTVYVKDNGIWKRVH